MEIADTPSTGQTLIKANDLPGQTNGQQGEIVKELQGWHRAKEEASHYNRNLLQYAAGIAAGLGIVAGSGGILAVALAVNGTTDAPPPAVGSLPFWILVTLLVLSYLSALISAILLGFLALAFVRRRRAERRAANHLERLIGLMPHYYLPTKDEVISGATERNE
jgi:hypothetical protein